MRCTLTALPCPSSTGQAGEDSPLRGTEQPDSSTLVQGMLQEQDTPLNLENILNLQHPGDSAVPGIWDSFGWSPESIY